MLADDNFYYLVVVVVCRDNDCIRKMFRVKDNVEIKHLFEYDCLLFSGLIYFFNSWLDDCVDHDNFFY